VNDAQAVWLMLVGWSVLALYAAQHFLRAWRSKRQRGKEVRQEVDVFLYQHGAVYKQEDE